MDAVFGEQGGLRVSCSFSLTTQTITRGFESLIGSDSQLLFNPSQLCDDMIDIGYENDMTQRIHSIQMDALFWLSRRHVCTHSIHTPRVYKLFS